MLRSLTRHLQARQGGMGVVGVSPRYAERVAHKFSQFWRLPHRVVKVWDSQALPCRLLSHRRLLPGESGVAASPMHEKHCRRTC